MISKKLQSIRVIGNEGEIYYKQDEIDVLMNNFPKLSIGEFKERKILVINTGGSIAMHRDKEGNVDLRRG